MRRPWVGTPADENIQQAEPTARSALIPVPACLAREAVGCVGERATDSAASLDAERQTVEAAERQDANATQAPRLPRSPRG